METMEVDSQEISQVEQPCTSSQAKESKEPLDDSIMAGSSQVPSVSCSLHPLVVMNISEHWTRIRAQAGEPQSVFGALIGKLKGRNIEVLNSFELKVDIVGNDVIINTDYYKKKETQYKQVFSQLDFIGWYTTGESPTEQDIKIQKQIAEINECPVMLQLNPLSRSVDQLPLKLYESIIDIVGGEAKMFFVPLTYTLATEEAERIGVDHVARMSTNETGEKSVVAEHLVAQYSAIKMLQTRVRIVHQYIQDVKAKLLPVNQEILSTIYSLSHQLPVMQGPAFQEEFYTQANDVALISYLGALTKGCNDMNQFVNRFNILYDRQSCGRRMRGIYY